MSGGAQRPFAPYHDDLQSPWPPRVPDPIPALDEARQMVHMPVIQPRFATREKFASYNATAPIEASSSPSARHRLNPRGNRKLNHAMHLIAVTQIGHAGTPGRVLYERKLAEGKTPKEAVRALKRRVSDAVWRQLKVDLGRR